MSRTDPASNPPTGLPVAEPQPRSPEGTGRADGVGGPRVVNGADGPSARPRVVTLKSVLTGLAAVLFICGLAPYNDYVVANTLLVGNYLPIGLVLFVTVLLLGINGPLVKWAPRWSYTAGELAVVLGMGLVACSIPTAGLMRYLPSSLVGMHYAAGQNVDFRRVLESADLPQWVFPRVAEGDVLGRANDPIITDFYGRNPTETGWSAVPWSAWVRPLGAWAIFLTGLYGAILCLAVIVRRQWVENERLAFPLASVYLSLIEPPGRGRLFNTLFRSWAFWIAAGFVFFIHATGALALYLPKVVPPIPVGYQLAAIFDETPLRHTEWGIKSASLYFSIIGITYFIQTKIAFSLWFFYVGYNVLLIWIRSGGTDVTWPMRNDQTIGVATVFAITMIWIGRSHWANVVRQMFRRPADGETVGRYLPYALAGWGLVAAVLLMVGWLMVAGVTVPGAFFLTLGLLTLMMVMAKVVAETGLIFAQILAPLHRPYIWLLADLPTPVRTTENTYFFTAWFNQMFVHDLREGTSVFATHALRVADDAAYPGETNWRRAIPFVGCLALALGVGYVVAATAMLHAEYNHAATLGPEAVSPINLYGVENSIRQQILEPSRGFFPPSLGPNENHSRIGHLLFGAGFAGVLSYLRLRLVSWPFHPVGLLLVYSYPLQRIWLSLFVGWLAKLLIVRFGGAGLMRVFRPVFIGLIVGEAIAAATWLVVALLLNAGGYAFQSIQLLPT